MLQRLGFPAVGRHRRLVVAVGIDALGSGIFIPVSILYFLVSTDLSLVQVGAALSLASLVALPAGPAIGSVVDRLGPKRVLLVANLVQAVGYAAYLFADSFAAVAAWTVLVSLGSTAFWGSYGTLVAAISQPGEREQWFGFLGALRNAGFAVGGLVAGLVISIGTVGAYGTVVVVNAVTYVVAFGLLLGVPRTTTTRESLPGSWGTVLADRPYRLLWLIQLGYAITMLTLNVAVPVYITRVLGLPGWLTGVMFSVNCLLIGVGQGLVVRALTGRVRWRILVGAQVALGLAFVMLLGLQVLPTAVAVVGGLVAIVVFTMGELTEGPVLSALAAEAAPAHLRGRYLSLIQLAWGIAGVVAPLGFAWLLDRGPSPTWVVLIGVVALAGAAAVLLGRRMPLAAEAITNRATGPHETVIT